MKGKGTCAETLHGPAEQSKGFELHAPCETACALLGLAGEYFRFPINKSLFAGLPCRPLKQATQVDLGSSQYFSAIETPNEEEQHKTHQEAVRKANQVQSTMPMLQMTC